MNKDAVISHISSWYAGKSVLITGATGFLGKALLEKLLRSCPDIKTIYLLLRSKKGITPEERLKTLLKNPLFDVVREENLESFKKINIINGEIMNENLGISSEDRTILIENVSIVFHVAATVRFDEPLHIAFSLNVVGTRKLVNLASSMTNLEAFVYISTAFSNCNNPEVEEKFYDPPMELHKLEQLFFCLDEDIVKSVTPKLLKNWPNTYTFTKACAEHLILSSAESFIFPAVIIRPSIVTAAWEQPIPGWIDNISGPTGMFLSGAKGIVRSFPSSSFESNFAPIDIVVNLMVSAAWYIGQEKCISVPIFNCSTETINGISNKKLKQYFEKNIEMYPFESTLWYPGAIIFNDRLKWKIHSIFSRTIPAYIIDFFLFITRNKRFAVKLNNKIDQFFEAYAYFTLGKWKFNSRNHFKILHCLTEGDKRKFNFDMRTIQWEEYVKNYHLGIRRFILNESLDNLNRARRRYNR